MIKMNREKLIETLEDMTSYLMLSDCPVYVILETSTGENVKIPLSHVVFLDSLGEKALGLVLSQRISIREVIPSTIEITI